MKKNDNIILNFYVHDYTKISDFCELEINSNDISNDIKNIIETNKTKILHDFLFENKEKIQKKFIGNLSDDDILEDLDENKGSIQVFNFNTNSFNGLIGIISKNDYSYRFNENEMYIFDIKVQILTRFDQNHKKAYFLKKLLLLNNDFSFIDSIVPIYNIGSFYDYLLMLRYKQLLIESFKKGFYKTYRVFNENGEKPKGRIDFQEHNKRNIGQNNGKIAYSYRENTVRNYLNYLILAAYNHLKKKFPELMNNYFTVDCENIINSLKAEIGFVNLKQELLINKNAKTINHPFYFEYENLRIICLRILRDEGIDFYDDKKTDEINGFLLSVSNLWEIYLKTYFEKNSFNYIYQDVQKMIGNDENQKFINICRPDFVLYKNDQPYAILDAKFTKKWSVIYNNNGLYGSRKEDFNKCVRDMTMFNCNKCGVIYPLSPIEINSDSYKEIGFIAHQFAEKYNINDKFFTFGIQIPNQEEVEEKQWQVLLEEETAEVFDLIKKYIN